MLPNEKNLKSVVGKDLEMDIKLTSQPDMKEGSMMKQYGISIIAQGNKVVLQRTELLPNSGIWIPYAETKSVVGQVDDSGGTTWLASGPFSGCEFVIGKNHTTNQIFAAHIAQQSGSTGSLDYRKFRSSNNVTEWYWNKISMPFDDRFSCNYLFVICNSGGIISMNTLAVEVTSMGGSNGRIANIKNYK